jgi:hypothetical protein
MNNDKIFRIELNALSPISVTKRVFGILYETYHFIPAWTMWNTLVKLYALENVEDEKIDYETAKNELREIRLTNFYIFDENDILLKIPENSRKKYIFSDFKTAIDPLSGSSLDNALYEREYIVAKKFVGWVKAPENLYVFFEEKLRGRIAFIGADKNTGFGKVKIENINSIINLNGLTGTMKDIAEKLNSPKNGIYLFPVENKSDDLFPVVLREWSSEKGMGSTIKYYL